MRLIHGTVGDIYEPGDILQSKHHSNNYNNNYHNYNYKRKSNRCTRSSHNLLGSA